MPLIGIAVPDVQRLKMKAIEHSPDIWVIVDADHHLALAAAHEVSHPLIVLEREIHAVTGGLPVRRVHIEEGVRAVVFCNANIPRKVLDGGARQTEVRRREVLLDPTQVDDGSRGGGTEVLTSNLPTEGVVL